MKTPAGAFAGSQSRQNIQKLHVRAYLPDWEEREQRLQGGIGKG
ncbi:MULTISPECIES: hypothetical protein [Coleofasciculaceae]|nr:hypothetical protein [Coleofasciculus sp. FACHB-1120]